MISEEALQRIVRTIQAEPELSGCLVAFVGNNQSRVVGYPSCLTVNSENIAVVIEEVCLEQQASSADLERMARSGNSIPRGAPEVSVIRNRSRLGQELRGAGVSCGLTVVSAVGLIGGTAAEVPTGGASTFLVVASWTGFAMGGIQCLNGLVRVGAIFRDPDDNTLEQWDKNDYYAYGILLVDALSVVGSLGSLPFGVRNLWAVIVRQRSFIARNLSFEGMRAMNRLQRLRVIAECFEEAARTPAGREALVKAAREASVGAKTMQRTSGISVNHADTLRRIISEETTRRLSSSLRDIIAGIVGMAASAAPAAVTGSASGSVNWIINLLDAGAPAI